MSFKNNYVAIMAGGIGSRFWPESRNEFPKQFLDILDTGKSLIQWTYERFKDICPTENIYIITNEAYISTLKSQIPDIQEQNILSEPSRKNTAACAAYIAHKLYALNPNANIVMSPSDHLIFDERKFERDIVNALDFVSKNEVLVTLGIKPTRPDTGYGYIQYNTSKKIEDFYQVKTFTEKPSHELAETFVRSGDFLWNAGIFVWNVNVILQELQLYLPEMNDVFAQVETYNKENEYQDIEKVYTQCTNISIDYGIMEKTKRVYVLPSYFGWCDLGTWNSAYENSKKDYLGNAVYGKNVMIIDSSQCMIKAPDDKLLVLQGLENFIIVDSNDVLLICERNREQQIKDYVAEVRRNKGDKFL
ncbi:MAG: mannose-1-phosphate guanylyltransferase [Chitinophagaceae bacterium]|nr:mannose-1-phosphate guanylyltransferase [Chitinophagaceae bacterium]HMN33040.1 mannose-1-phosphate guanylyltransferase [Chitinophagaceae bacterium]